MSLIWETEKRVRERQAMPGYKPVKLTTKGKIACILLAVTILALVNITVHLAFPVKPVKPKAAVTEDDPGWNCRTQGNQVCAGGRLWDRGVLDRWYQRQQGH